MNHGRGALSFEKPSPWAIWTLYFGERRSISWDVEKAVLRCSLLVSKSDDVDFACQIRVTPTAAVLNFGTDEGREQIKFKSANASPFSTSP